MTAALDLQGFEAPPSVTNLSPRQLLPVSAEAVGSGSKVLESRLARCLSDLIGQCGSQPTCRLLFALTTLLTKQSDHWEDLDTSQRATSLRVLISQIHHLSKRNDARFNPTNPDSPPEVLVSPRSPSSNRDIVTRPSPSAPATPRRDSHCHRSRLRGRPPVPTRLVVDQPPKAITWNNPHLPSSTCARQAQVRGDLRPALKSIDTQMAQAKTVEQMAVVERDLLAVLEQQPKRETTRLVDPLGLELQEKTERLSALRQSSAVARERLSKLAKGDLEGYLADKSLDKSTRPRLPTCAMDRQPESLVRSEQYPPGRATVTGAKVGNPRCRSIPRPPSQGHGRSSVYEMDRVYDRLSKPSVRRSSFRPLEEVQPIQESFKQVSLKRAMLKSRIEASRPKVEVRTNRAFELRLERARQLRASGGIRSVNLCGQTIQLPN